MEDRPWLMSYDEGVPHTIEYPGIPLHALLEVSAKTYGDSICTVFYAQHTPVCDGIFCHFEAGGYRSGD
jgi:hypothetical protein